MLAWALRAFGRAPGKAPAYAAIALLACANVAYVVRTNGGRPGKGGDDAMDAARAQRRAAMRAALSTSARAGDGDRERGGGDGVASAGGERGGERGGGGGGWWFK